MYIILIRYVKPIEAVDQQKAAHSKYLDKFYAEGRMIVSGRRIDLTGGVLIANMAARAEVEQMIEGEPYKTSGVAEYEVIDFHPSKYAQDFGPFLLLPQRPTELAPDTPASDDAGSTAR